EAETVGREGGEVLGPDYEVVTNRDVAISHDRITRRLTVGRALGCDRRESTPRCYESRPRVGRSGKEDANRTTESECGVAGTNLYGDDGFARAIRSGH